MLLLPAGICFTMVSTHQKKVKDCKNIQEQPLCRISTTFDKITNKIDITKRDDDLVRELCMRIAKLHYALKYIKMKLQDHEESIASDSLDISFKAN